MRLAMVVAALRQFHNGITGNCNLCGWPTYFLCTDSSTARNNMVCPWCRSYSRKRHVTKVLLDVVEKAYGTRCRSVRDIPDGSKVRILSASVADTYRRVLNQHPAFTFSDLVPDVRPGTKIGPRSYCQNLEAMSFEDASFEVVITEDVLEHVRRPLAALREIHRILVPGGVHIFTVPFYFDRPTLTRVDTTSDEDIQIVFPPEYHGDSLRGSIIAYRTFGIDLFEQLACLGFATTVQRSSYADARRGLFDSYVFVSKKQAKRAESRMCESSAEDRLERFLPSSFENRD